MDLAKYQHVIWDWNGTLLDDVWLAVETMNGLLRRRRMPTITIDEYVGHFDFPVIDYYRRLGFDFDKEAFEIVAIEFIDDFEARRFEARLHAGAVETLDAVARAGLGQSVLSATQHDSLQEYVAHFGITDRFERMLGLADHYAHGKTDLGRQWLAEAGIDPATVLYIGDTTHDAETAQAIGVDCILIAHGHQRRERLEQTGARVVERYSEILRAI